MVPKIPWYSIGRFSLIVLCLAIVLALVVTVLPIYLDITAIKGPVEELLSDFTEAPVTVREVRLHPSPWPTLRVAGVEVAGSGQESSPPFSHIDQVEIRLSLLPLLRKQLRLQRLFVSGATFHAHRPEGRSGNWPVWTASRFQINELAGIDLENVTLVLEDHQTVRATMVVDHLTCDIAKDRPLDLKLRGSLEGLPLSVSAGGPTLAAPLSQASDYPLSLLMELADLRLDLQGSASREPGGTRFQFAFDIDSEGLTFVRELGVTEIPHIGGLQLAGTLSNRNSALEVTELEGSIGSTTVHGQLALNLPDWKPEVSGRLSLGQLDLEPWLNSSSDAKVDTSTPLPFSLLSAADADLKLSLKELTGLEVAVDDIDLEVQLENGVLSIPATLRTAGIPLSAQLDVEATQEVPHVSSRVWARDLFFEQLAQIVDIPDDLDGRIGALDLDITSSGHSIDALSANLLVEASADETALAVTDDAGEQLVEIYFDQARATHRPGSPLTATARGSLFEESFTIDLQTASLSDLIEHDKWPLSLSAQGAGATVDLEGTLEQAATGLDFDLEFDLSGDRLGDLESWLGFPSHAGLAYELNGHLTSATGTRLLRLDDSFIGRTHFAGEFAWSTDDQDEPFMVDLHAMALDVRELRELSSSVTDLDTEQEVLGIDMPILPSKKHLHDGEIELTVARLLRDTVDLTDVSATFHIRQGRLERSPFSFVYDTQQFTCEINLDLREEVPKFALEFHGDGKDLGEILQQEGIIEDFVVVAERLDLRIDASGATVREIIQSADLSGQLVDVRWKIQPAAFEEPVNVRLESVDLSGPKGEPIVLTANGLLDQEPLDLRLALRFPEDPQDRQTQSLPFALTIGLAATKIELDGEAHLPITEGEFDMDLTVEGETFETLSAPLDVDLPDIGPYQLKSHLAFGEGGFALEDLDFVVGESDLHGEISYSRVDDRPTVIADLSSQLIRTEDIFELDQAAEGEEQEEVPASHEDQKSTASPKLTLDNFNGFDADIDLALQKILTVGGQTEDLVVEVDLANGSFDLSIRGPQESDKDMQLNARILPWQQGLEAEVQAYWDRQPYGLLADILNPGAAGGSWSVDLDLTSRGSSFDELAASLSGHLYFADYPVDFDATIFDLWGGGLISSLLPVFQIGAESRVNCSVARFQVDQGVLTPESLIIDSTRSRINGKGTIDLPGNEIRLRLKPRPKQRSLINLATPVTIRGSLTEPNVQISKGGLAVTFFRLSLWVYTVWRDLVRTPLPADGQDICVDPFQLP